MKKSTLFLLTLVCAAGMAAGLAAATSWAMAGCLVSLMADAVSAAPDTSQIATLAPSLASARATALPIPRPPPVTIATLSLHLIATPPFLLKVARTVICPSYWPASFSARPTR